MQPWPGRDSLLAMADDVAPQLLLLTHRGRPDLSRGDIHVVRGVEYRVHMVSESANQPGVWVVMLHEPGQCPQRSDRPPDPPCAASER